MTEKAHELLSKNWPLVITTLTCAVMWGTLTAQVTWLSSGQEKVLAKLDKQAEQISGFAAGVAGVQATELASIAALADLRQRVGQIEARR